MSVCTGQTLHIFVGHGSDAAHALHDVEHQAFGLQQRASLARNHHGDVAFLHLGTIIDKHLHLKCGVKTGKHLLGHLYSGKDSVFLDEQMRAAHGLLRNTTQGGVVAITYIFGKCQINQSVF